MNRKLHRWGAILVAVPLAVIVVSGILLQLKKNSDWIQPSTGQGVSTAGPILGFEEILKACRGVPEADISTWDDVDRLDVRPEKGIVKVRSRTRWEVQVDTKTGEVVQVAYRRSDLIESIHDGSFFGLKFWIFLPTAVVLAVLWVTGIYLWFLPHLVKRRRKRRNAAATSR